jgi:hypothetical protein
VTYLDQLGDELARVGIHGQQRSRVVAEAADHIAEGGAADFGDPRELAQLFADELATQATTRASYLAFAVLGAAFAAGWLQLVMHGAADITSAEFVPVGVMAAFALIACPQICFAAGLLMLLRTRRLRRLRVAPAAELALLTRQTRTALTFGAVTVLAFATYAIEYRMAFTRWDVLAAVIAVPVLSLPLAAAAEAGRRTAIVQSAAPGQAGDMFDDLPIRLPRRPRLVCFALAGALAVLLFVAGGLDEGPRNAVAEAVLVIGSFAALRRRLGLR